MLDTALRNGTIVDGTGSPAYRGDVGVKDGRIFELGSTVGQATRNIDCEGLVITPGFVDVHTHYDAQVLWDPLATPSPLHGVTTVFGGNCGFTIAPLGDGDADYIMEMMARVEGMPLTSLKAGPAWDWRSFGEWLDQLEGCLGINAGFLVGHSTIRRVAMGADCVGGTPTPAQLEHMVRMVRESCAAGALGFSSSLGEAHTDGDGNPVPSRASSHEELLTLAAAIRDYEGTSLEFIAAMGEIPQARIELMSAMSKAANRPLNWNLLGSLSPTPVYDQQLSSCDHAAANGGRVVALALPDLMRMRAHRVIEDMPGWREVAALGDGERRAAAGDASMRAQLHEGAKQIVERGMAAFANFDRLEIADSHDSSIVGRTVGELARTRGVDPIDVLIDEVLVERSPLQMVFPSLDPTLGTSDEGWQVRKNVWNDPRVVLGGSDAGAHTDLLCHANYPTIVLSEMVRDRGIFTLEQAVHKLSDVPARLYGLRERGRIVAGWHADLVVYDPAQLASGPARARNDLPAGGERLYAEATGYRHVFVNGHEIVRDDTLTGELGGTLLRSGRDTETVTP